MADWLDAIRERGGPFVEAARAFWAWRGEGELPRGEEAIAFLADQVDLFAHETDAADEDDDRFLEGAGALLGLVLADVLGGRHVVRERAHRVLLGDHGFFDPFAAIDDALDADEPCDALAERIRQAEAEARGEGPVGRVVRGFALALADEVPGARILERFGYEVTLDDGAIVDLQRVAEATGDQGFDAVHQAAAKMARMLRREDAERLPWEEAAPRLLPRLVGPSFLDGLPESDARGELYLAPLGADVKVALQLAYPGRARNVRRDEVDAWRAEGGAVRAEAIRNLARRSQQCRFAHVEGDDGAFVVGKTGDGLDAARLLLPTLHRVLRAELEDPLVVAAPHRDTLLAATFTPWTVGVFQEQVEDAFRKAPHPISAAVFALDELGLRPLDGR